MSVSGYFKIYTFFWFQRLSELSIFVLTWHDEYIADDLSQNTTGVKSTEDADGDQNHVGVKKLRKALPTSVNNDNKECIGFWYSEGLRFFLQYLFKGYKQEQAYSLHFIAKNNKFVSN